MKIVRRGRKHITNFIFYVKGFIGWDKRVFYIVNNAGANMILELELLETISLENGLILTLYNSSKRVADRLWYIAVTGRIEIPVTETVMIEDGTEIINVNNIKSILGDNLVFEKKLERNFVFEDQKESTLQMLLENFRTSIAKYLSHSEFARQYIFKCYRDAVKNIRR